jgi:hypothetical protein
MPRKTSSKKSSSPKPTREEKAKAKLSSKRRLKPVEVFSLYCHVSNSGVTFKVLDQGFGPTLVVKQSAFGNLESDQSFHLTKATLKRLAKELTAAAKFDFTEDYDCAADSEFSKQKLSSGSTGGRKRKRKLSRKEIEDYESLVKSAFSEENADSMLNDLVESLSGEEFSED